MKFPRRDAHTHKRIRGPAICFLVEGVAGHNSLYKHAKTAFPHEKVQSPQGLHVEAMRINAHRSLIYQEIGRSQSGPVYTPGYTGAQRPLWHRGGIPHHSAGGAPVILIRPSQVSGCQGLNKIAQGLVMALPSIHRLRKSATSYNFTVASRTG